jgi:hypothetical protein
MIYIPIATPDKFVSGSVRFVLKDGKWLHIRLKGSSRTFICEADEELDNAFLLSKSLFKKFSLYLYRRKDRFGYWTTLEVYGDDDLILTRQVNSKSHLATTAWTADRD